MNPTPVKRVPTWDLAIVLRALTKEPFEPMATISLKLLSIKTLFLVAVTSARRLSEFGALRILGRRVSLVALAKWLRLCFSLAYEALGLSPLDGILARSV